MLYLVLWELDGLKRCTSSLVPGVNASCYSQWPANIENIITD